MKATNRLKSTMIQNDRTLLQSYKYVSVVIKVFLLSSLNPAPLCKATQIIFLIKSDTVCRLLSVFYRDSILDSKQWMNYLYLDILWHH